MIKETEVKIVDNTIDPTTTTNVDNFVVKDNMETNEN